MPKLLTLDWRRMELGVPVTSYCYRWVDDKSIETAFRAIDRSDFGHWDSPAVPHHAGTNRADRIATIAWLMMRRGVVFPPFKLSVPTDSAIGLVDGHHRLRAYQFLGRLTEIRVEVHGDARRVMPFARVPRPPLAVSVAHLVDSWQERQPTAWVRRATDALVLREARRG